MILLFLSSRTNLGEGFIAKELEAATRLASQSTGPILIPVRLDQSEPPHSLRRVQWVDYFAPDGLERLIEAIEGGWRARRRRRSNECDNWAG